MKKTVLALILLSTMLPASAQIGRVYRSDTTTLKITPYQGGYQIDAAMSLGPCSGHYTGKGSLQGNVLSTFDAATAQKEGGDHDEYVMKIRFSNHFRQAVIIQEAGSYYHGASCAFTDGGNPNLKKVR